MLTLNKSKKIVCLIIVIIMLLQVKTFAVVSQTNDFYVNDYARKLSSDTKEYIMNMNIELQKKTGAQIVVVTVQSLGGQSIEEYATELFRKFGIGDKEKNNGVLLLCSTGDRLFRIEVGYGLEGRLTDGKTGRIQDEYIIPYLKENDYDGGIRNGFTAILNEVASEYGVTISGTDKLKKPTYSDGEFLTYFTILIVWSIIGMIINYIIRKKGFKTILITNTIDILIFGIISCIMIKEKMWLYLMIHLMMILHPYSRRSGGDYFGGRRIFWWRPVASLEVEVLLAEAVVQEVSK